MGLCPVGVVSNIHEQVRFFGPTTSVRSIDFPIIGTDETGEMVADGIAEGRFLLLTAPVEVRKELARHASDPDAYLLDQMLPDASSPNRVIVTDVNNL